MFPAEAESSDRNRWRGVSSNDLRNILSWLVTDKKEIRSSRCVLSTQLSINIDAADKRNMRWKESVIYCDTRIDIKFLARHLQGDPRAPRVCDPPPTWWDGFKGKLAAARFIQLDYTRLSSRTPCSGISIDVSFMNGVSSRLDPESRYGISLATSIQVSLERTRCESRTTSKWRAALEFSIFQSSIGRWMKRTKC